MPFLHCQFSLEDEMEVVHGRIILSTRKDVGTKSNMEANLPWANSWKNEVHNCLKRRGISLTRYQGCNWKP